MNKINRGKKNVPKIAVAALVCLLGVSAFAFSSTDAFADMMKSGSEQEVAASNYIGEDAAKEILLAKLPGATITELELDDEDGVATYQGAMVLDNVVYEFSVDATSGVIVAWNVDEELCADDQGDNTDNDGDVNDNSSDYIGIAAVKEILLGKVPGATITEIELENDGGRVLYDGSMYLDNTVYEFEIDAVSGQIISWDSEQCDDNDENVNDSQEELQDDSNDAAEELNDAALDAAEEQNDAALDAAEEATDN